MPRDPSAAVGALKRHVPFAVRHRLRMTVDYVVGRPKHFASGSAEHQGRLVRAYARWYLRRHFSTFFEPLLSPGDLAFDVGANVGAWTSGLRALGCRVVAIEPQPECATAISAGYRGDSGVTVVPAAVGATSGEAELFLAASTEHASISHAWMESMIDRGGVSSEYWTHSIRVPVRTLDDLISEFGVPAYIKLDVEGAEADALRGLSVAIRLISFESHGQTVADAHEIVALLLALGSYEFNLTPGEFPALAWPAWRGHADLLAALEAEPYGWNNVFARLRGRP